MQIGEEYRVTLDSTVPDTKFHRPPVCGKVVFIHPAGRYATLEFQGVHGKFRETFPLDQLTLQNRVRQKGVRG